MIVNNYVSNLGLNNQAPIKMTLDLRTLNCLVRYILQPQYYLKMEHLVNMKKLIQSLDRSTYENDPEKVARIDFIAKVIEARLDNNINDLDLILTYVNGGIQYPIDFVDLDNLSLSKDEVMYLHNLVSEILQYRFLYDYVDKMLELGTQFKSSDFNTRGNIIHEIEDFNNRLKNEFRKSRVNDNAIDMTFSLREGEFENAITNTWNMITNPSRRLICGMQGLNEMTGGGFESGRVYMLLGTSGVGKSITLLNLIYQMKRFNRFYKTNDPTKTPCIVLLTMENTVVETITRLFSMVTENNQNMANYSAPDCINMLRTQGELVVNDSSPIDIVIKYKPNRSIDTSYLYTLYDDLEDDGYEMICLVQDHVKRIRSMSANSDLRLELGDVVNDLKVFAADKDIPVITNSHLNRDAAKTIEDAARANKQDVGKLLGKSNIGESMLMIDNLDCGIILALDYDKDGNKYMTFNLIKMRDRTDRTYIAQPFSIGSTIRLLEDYGGIPQFKESIRTAPEIKHNNIMKVSGSSSMMSAMLDFKTDDIDDDDNVFTTNKDYLHLDLEKENNALNNMEDMFSAGLSDLNSLSEEIARVTRPVIHPIIFRNTSMCVSPITFHEIETKEA